MRIGRKTGLVAAGFLGGLAVAAALTVPAFSGPYPATMLAIPVFDLLPETRGDHILKLDGKVPADEMCRALTVQFGMSPEKVTEAGFDLRVSTRAAVRDNVLQEVWRRKGWLEKLRSAYFGPTKGDAERARREMLALRGSVVSQLRVAHSAMACAGQEMAP